MSLCRICVAVRKRPPKFEKEDIVDCGDPECFVNETKVKYDLTPYIERHAFIYDMVMDERTNNRQVYRRCAEPLIDTVFSKGNATCFAYGQTGSGKTHTMLGHGEEPGLYACAAKDIFARSKMINARVFVSFYEIYGRKIFDLLNDRNKLVARENHQKEIVICGLSEHPAGDISELFNTISKGSQYRAAGQTSANSESSRSHAVLQLEVRDVAKSKTVGKISFIDLAGNERGVDTYESDRKTRMEGAEINKSLLALKECIRALGMGKSHVPFRGTILTEVLRDSFLGNSRTCMIGTISPISQHCENTLNTLRYAQRVKDFTGVSGGGRREVIGQGPGENNKRTSPQVKLLRKQPFGSPLVMGAVNRPDWVDDFADETPVSEGVFGTPPPVRRASNADRAKRFQEVKQKVMVKDPHIASIVAQHIKNLEDDDIDDDNVDSENDDLNVTEEDKENKQVRAVHAHVVSEITKAEDEIMSVHRQHIDNKMIGIKEEIKAIQALDDKDSVDEYVVRVKDILFKQRVDIDAIMGKLDSLQKMLKEEEDLSKTFSPQVNHGGKGNVLPFVVGPSNNNAKFKPNYGR